MRAHVAEFLGTFAIVFFGCGAIANGLPPVAVAAAFGLSVAVGIFAFGHVSGAHFNPAVSIGFAIGRHFPWTRAATYAVAQVIGAVSAAGVLRLTVGSVESGVTHAAGGAVPSVVWEVVMTATLMIVITAVATDVRVVGQVAPLAVGGAVAVCALVGGSVSGASLNPARSIGPAIVAGDLADLAIYVVAPVLGAVVGAVLYAYLRGPSAARRTA